MPHQERLARLEELCYFQEQAIASLNEALTFQQAQISTLEKRLQLTEEKLQTVYALLDNAGGEVTVPPHSVPGLY